MTKQAAATIQERINTNSPFVNKSHTPTSVFLLFQIKKPRENLHCTKSPFVNKAHAPTSVFILFQIKKTAGKLALYQKSSYFCHQ